jgi:dihydrofolate reductase
MNDISLIAAVAENNVLGANNTMLWHIPEDFKYFQENTKNKMVIMGRLTYLSILPFTKNKPLPMRDNVVLSTQSLKHEGFTFVDSVEKALSIKSNQEHIDNSEKMIIGGAKVYELFLPFASKIYLTEIEKSFEGDAYFPRFDKSLFEKEVVKSSTHNGLNFNFVIYHRK